MSLEKGLQRMRETARKYGIEEEDPVKMGRMIVDKYEAENGRPPRYGHKFPIKQQPK